VPTKAKLWAIWWKVVPANVAKGIWEKHVVKKKNAQTSATMGESFLETSSTKIVNVLAKMVSEVNFANKQSPALQIVGMADRFVV
jgi:hypothetical protein